MGKLSFDDEVTGNLDKLLAKAGKAASFSLYEIGRQILLLTEPEVPHDVGTLQGTGTVQPSGQDWLVGFNTVYAARLHEHPEYRFQNGRKGKYLEDPIRNNLDALGLDWGKNVAINLSGGI